VNGVLEGVAALGVGVGDDVHCGASTVGVDDLGDKVSGHLCHPRVD
jgi:hypothetical protein